MYEGAVSALPHAPGTLGAPDAGEDSGQGVCRCDCERSAALAAAVVLMAVAMSIVMAMVMVRTGRRSSTAPAAVL